jgi:serine protease Do
MQIYRNSSVFIVSMIGFVAGAIFMYAVFKPISNVVGNNEFAEESFAVAAVDLVKDAVVSVYSVKGDGAVVVVEGSGFFVNDAGVFLTNKHVLKKGDGIKYKAVLSDGDEYFADLVYEDPLDDVAMLKVVDDGASGARPGAAARKFSYVKFGDSDDMKVGMKVLAFGNALAEYQNTVTMGIISGKGRQITAKTGAGITESESLSGLLQTDAAINLGNSGGALVNLNGEVIGMNVAVVESGNGVGFAIPSNDLRPLVESFLKNGKVLRPMMGVRFIMLNKNQAKKYEVDIDQGALLVGDVSKGELAVISGGSADKAGLKALDVILEVDGEKVDEEHPLNRLIRFYEPGNTIKLKVLRGGEIIYKDLVLGNSLM